MLDLHLIDIISRNFGLLPDQITPETSADTVSEWDSVGHLKLILDLEETYAIRFPAPEITKLRSAGSIQAALDRLTRR